METSTIRTRTAPKMTTSRTTRATTPAVRLTTEQREQLIRETAYFLAERDSFRGDPVSYWVTAEKQVNKRF
jgi:hypothetical protein